MFVLLVLLLLAAAVSCDPSRPPYQCANSQFDNTATSPGMVGQLGWVFRFSDYAGEGPTSDPRYEWILSFCNTTHMTPRNGKACTAPGSKTALAVWAAKWDYAEESSRCVQWFDTLESSNAGLHKGGEIAVTFKSSSTNDRLSVTVKCDPHNGNKIRWHSSTTTGATTHLPATYSQLCSATAAPGAGGGTPAPGPTDPSPPGPPGKRSGPPLGALIAACVVVTIVAAVVAVVAIRLWNYQARTD